jgi:hypothetical protein
MPPGGNPGAGGPALQVDNFAGDEQADPLQRARFSAAHVGFPPVLPALTRFDGVGGRRRLAGVPRGRSCALTPSVP